MLEYVITFHWLASGFMLLAALTFGAKNSDLKEKKCIRMGLTV